MANKKQNGVMDIWRYQLLNQKAIEKLKIFFFNLLQTNNEAFFRMTFEYYFLPPMYSRTETIERINNRLRELGASHFAEPLIKLMSHYEPMTWDMDQWGDPFTQLLRVLEQLVYSYRDDASFAETIVDELPVFKWRVMGYLSGISWNPLDEHLDDFMERHKEEFAEIDPSKWMWDTTHPSKERIETYLIDRAVEVKQTHAAHQH